MKKVFIFLGPPGCGKGTQTTRLSQKLDIPHVDTGSLLRKIYKIIHPLVSKLKNT